MTNQTPEKTMENQELPSAWHESNKGASGIKYLRVKIKSLAGEARIIKHEEDKTVAAIKCATRRGLDAAAKKGTHILYSLHHHRTWEVRSAARYALLAYAFLRGVPYEALERNPLEHPNMERLCSQVLRFGNPPKGLRAPARGGEEGPGTVRHALRAALRTWSQDRLR